MSNCSNNPNILIAEANLQKVISPQSPTSVSGSDEKVGRWSKEEHAQFLKGLELYGREWKKISHLIPSRTVVQVRTHAQKYFHKLQSGKSTPTNSPKNQPSQSMPNTPILSSNKIKSSPIPNVPPLTSSLSNGSILSLKNLNFGDNIPKPCTNNSINRIVYTNTNTYTNSNNNNQVPPPPVNNILPTNSANAIVPLPIPTVNNTNIQTNYHRTNSSRNSKNNISTINPSHLLQSVLYPDIAINKNSTSPRAPNSTEFPNVYLNSRLGLMSSIDNSNNNNTNEILNIDNNNDNNSINLINNNINNVATTTTTTSTGVSNPYSYNSMGSLNSFINNVNNIKNGNCFSNTNTIYADSSSSTNSLFSPINHGMFQIGDLSTNSFSLDHTLYDHSFGNNDNDYLSFNFRTQEENVFSFDRDLNEILRHNDDICF